MTTVREEQRQRDEQSFRDAMQAWEDFHPRNDTEDEVTMELTMGDLVGLVESFVGERTSESGRDDLRREIAVWLTSYA